MSIDNVWTHLVLLETEQEKETYNIFGYQSSKRAFIADAKTLFRVSVISAIRHQI